MFENESSTAAAVVFECVTLMVLAGRKIVAASLRISCE